MDTSDRGGREGVLDDNVVRLPRDWLGPREDLIPFGTTSERGPSGGSAPTADDFWGESSAAVQDAVQRPPIQAHSTGRPRSLARGRALLVGLVAAAAAAVLAVLLVGAGGQHVPRRSSSLSASRVSPSVFVGAATHRAVASSARALRLARAHHHRPKTVRHKTTSPSHAAVTAAVTQPVTTPVSPASSSVSTTSPATTSSPVASSSSSNAAASTVVNSPSSNSGTETAPASSTGSGQSSGSGSAKSSGSQPATGADGALAPGSSPDS